MWSRWHACFAIKLLVFITRGAYLLEVPHTIIGVHERWQKGATEKVWPVGQKNSFQWKFASINVRVVLEPSGGCREEGAEEVRSPSVWPEGPTAATRRGRHVIGRGQTPPVGGAESSRTGVKNVTASFSRLDTLTNAEVFCEFNEPHTMLLLSLTTLASRRYDIMNFVLWRAPSLTRCEAAMEAVCTKGGFLCVSIFNSIVFSLFSLCTLVYEVAMQMTDGWNRKHWAAKAKHNALTHSTRLSVVF